MYLGGDALESLGSVVDCVHCRHVGQQGLRCADVTRRLVSADVLLSRLQSKAVRVVTVHVPGQVHC